MKRYFLLAAPIAALILLIFSGCIPEYTGGDPLVKAEIDQGYSISYAFTPSSEVLTLSDSTSVKDYMDALKEDGVLTFEGSQSEYGFFISSVLGVENRTVSSTANSYSGYGWTVYTTLREKDGVPYVYEDSTFVYDAIILYKASYGVSGIPCVEGETYALVYELSSSSW